jgi:hypothetical protein
MRGWGRRALFAPAPGQVAARTWPVVSILNLMNLKTKAWLAHPWGALRQLRLSITVSAAYPRWAHGRKGSGNACAGYRPLSTPILWRRQRPARGSRGMVSRDCWRWTYEAPAKPAGSRSAHKWCTAARTCFALERPCLRGHVFRAVSPGRVSRDVFGIHRVFWMPSFFIEIPSRLSDSGPALSVSAPSPVPRAFKASKGGSVERSEQKT